MASKSDLDHNAIVPIQEHSCKTSWIRGQQAYDKLYKESITNNSAYWNKQAMKYITWEQPYSDVMQGTFREGDLRWFIGGKLNASVNCLDRHIHDGKGHEIALIWEADEPSFEKTGIKTKWTFAEMLNEVCKIANVLRKYGVRKSDPVTIYLPMTPQVVFTMLACARIGAPHSIVFAGFSAEALKERIVDVQSRFVVTCDEGLRGGKKIALKKTTNTAIFAQEHQAARDIVRRIFVFHRTNAKIDQTDVECSLDVHMEEEMKLQRGYCVPETMDSEDPLFYLYTSGSTGKPKGVMHTTAGYLLFTGFSFKMVFDYHPGDIYACAADCGWITGHSYIVYGPLLNAATTVIFESTPLYPNHERYWDMIQKHKVTQFYTAPTAIRALMRYGNDCFKRYDLSSLRVLGTVGEPINPEAWKWYYENVGMSRCAIVDTYWQTETGGFLMTPLVGCTPLKPGSCTKPFFGIAPVLVDPESGKEIPHVAGEETHGVLCISMPFPSLTRTVHDNHERYMNTYFTPYPGYYFTGDGCTRDKDGYFWITGRVDDVLNVSGHRIGSAEIESALVGYDAVAEAAVIGIPHEVKGEGIAVYVILKQKYSALVQADEEPDDLKHMRQDLKNQVRKMIGPIATPDLIIFTEGLPKTRSGKIMRRVLRKIIANEDLGDISTLADPGVVDELKKKVKVALA